MDCYVNRSSPGSPGVRQNFGVDNPANVLGADPVPNVDTVPNADTVPVADPTPVVDPVPNADPAPVDPVPNPNAENVQPQPPQYEQLQALFELGWENLNQSQMVLLMANNNEMQSQLTLQWAQETLAMGWENLYQSQMVLLMANNNEMQSQGTLQLAQETLIMANQLLYNINNPPNPPNPPNQAESGGGQNFEVTVEGENPQELGVEEAEQHEVEEPGGQNFEVTVEGENPQELGVEEAEQHEVEEPAQVVNWRQPRSVGIIRPRHSRRLYELKRGPLAKGLPTWRGN